MNCLYKLPLILVLSFSPPLSLLPAASPSTIPGKLLLSRPSVAFMLLNLAHYFNSRISWLTTAFGTVTHSVLLITWTPHLAGFTFISLVETFSIFVNNFFLFNLWLLEYPSFFSLFTKAFCSLSSL
jgi:hypothetical protein